jgi:hypothetical protein
VLLKENEQGLARVTDANACEVLVLSDGGLLSQRSPANTVKPSDALFQKRSMDRIVFPPGRVGHTAPVAQERGVPSRSCDHSRGDTASEARECCAPFHCSCEQRPLGRRTAPGKGRTVESTRQNSLRHSRFSSESEPSIT